MTGRWKRAQAYEADFWVNKIRQKGPFVFEPDSSYVLGLPKYLQTGYFSGKRVLEVGCGPHGPIYRIDASFKVGVEPLAAKFYREFGQPNKTVKILQGVGECPPFAASSFDAVVLWNAIDHSSGPFEILKEVRRVLRENGAVIMYVHAIRPIALLFRPLLDILDKGHPFHLTVGQYVRLLKKAGFAIEHTKRTPFRAATLTLKRRTAQWLVENIWTIASPR